ncbi:MAG TPA: hypothetical protein VK604_19830 [Bryobacteraceae bacterium]|nr:hypothetical protein [Bryobacteraceae bacterium]
MFWLFLLQLRYAMEAWPYSIALALTIWSTVAFLDLLEEPTALLASVYALFIVTGLYTQPYSLFVAAAHVLWLLSAAVVSGRHRNVVFLTRSANVSAALLFLPWYLHVHDSWAKAVPTVGHSSAVKIAEVIVKELVGGGYIGSAVVLTLAAVGIKVLYQSRTTVYLYVFWLVVPLLLTLIGNAIFGYFLAIRQMIFALGPLCLLATIGMEAIAARRPKAVVWLSALLLGVCLFNDVRLFLKPREDWKTASFDLKHLSGNDTCLVFIPKSSLDLYRVFDPALADSNCMDHLRGQRTLVLAISPYASREAIDSAMHSISESVFHKEREMNSAGPKISIYRRN